MERMQPNGASAKLGAGRGEGAPGATELPGPPRKKKKKSTRASTMQRPLCHRGGDEGPRAGPQSRVAGGDSAVHVVELVVGMVDVESEDEPAKSGPTGPFASVLGHAARPPTAKRTRKK